MVWWLGGSISDTIRFLGGRFPKIKKQMLFVGVIQYGGFLKWWLPRRNCAAWLRSHAYARASSLQPLLAGGLPFLMCCDHCRASGGFPWKQSYDLFFRICGTFFCRPASRPKKLDQWVHLCLGGSDVCYRPMHPPGYASGQQIPQPLCWKNCRIFRQWDPLSHPTSETLLRPLVCLSGAIRGMASRKGWSQRHSVAIWLDAVG